MFVFSVLIFLGLEIYKNLLAVMIVSGAVVAILATVIVFCELVVLKDEKKVD